MDEAVQRKVAALRARYAVALVAQAEELARAIVAWRGAPSDEALMADCWRISHTLGGTSGSYGFHDVSTAARAIQALFTDGRPEAAAVDVQLGRCMAAAAMAIKA